MNTTPTVNTRPFTVSIPSKHGTLDDLRDG
jgi:hypothetical protein